MPDNFYYGVKKQSTQGTALPISERAMPRLLDHATLPIAHDTPIITVKMEYNGKQYRGMLYPIMEDEKVEESNAKQ